MKKLSKKTMNAILGLTTVPLISVSLLYSANATTPTGIDTTKNCIYNGYHYTPPATGIAETQHCFYTPDDSVGAPPKVATVDPTKTLNDLKTVQNTSPLDPSHYLAQGSFATTPLGNAPATSNSSQIANFVANDLAPMYLPDQFKPWLRSSANIGGGVAANDNIPIYTVDSSNPNQEFANFATTDPRVTNFHPLYELTSGSIPLPSWAKPSDGGDHALAIYDVATGIFRGYFHAVQDPNTGVWNYASAGYWYGDKTSQTAGDDNYWLGYIQGSNSVIGVSNELTQIGAQEVKDGVINHTVSVTFPNYLANTVSFPAKQTDGKLDPATYPNAPAAGQRFTFPADFDVEAYITANNIDPTTAAIIRAVKQYGGIVSDKNFWDMAFNFENPYGMGARADNPNANPWKDDPVLASKINNMNINKFPWASTQWLPVNYAGTTASLPVDNTPTADPSASDSATPTTTPTASDSATDSPTTVPSDSSSPTTVPTDNPTDTPSATPTESTSPSVDPTTVPSTTESSTPTSSSSASDNASPSTNPSISTTPTATTSASVNSTPSVTNNSAVDDVTANSSATTVDVNNKPSVSTTTDANGNTVTTVTDSNGYSTVTVKDKNGNVISTKNNVHSGEVSTGASPEIIGLGVSMLVLGGSALLVQTLRNRKKN